MFEELMENYKRLSTSDKRDELLKELKLMLAFFEQMCIDKQKNYREIKSREILDLNSGKETEADYLEATYVYVEYLKEVLGSLFNN